MAGEYDSGDSDDDYEDLDELRPAAPFKFELYEHLNSEATAGQGGLKSYGVKKGGSPIYAERRSDYSVLVDRLLWVDGYEETTSDGNVHKHGREMTLVVLKLSLTSLNPDKKFRYVNATLKLKDKDGKGKNEPNLVAWAPFRTWERWNPSVGHRETTDKTELGVKAGYSGSDVSAMNSRESKISWDRTEFDEAGSSEETSKLTHRRNGVTWFMKHNDQENKGVTQEVWVSALFARSSRAPYVVKFNIYTHAGSRQEAMYKTRRFFGTKPGQTTAFAVTPWQETICKSEGEDIIKTVDLDNLGKLRTTAQKGMTTSLNVTWGPDYQVSSPEAPQPKSPQPETPQLAKEAVVMATSATAAVTRAAAMDGAQVSEAASMAMRVPVDMTGYQPPLTAPTPHAHTANPQAAAQNGPQVQFSTGPGPNGLPPLMVGWYNPSSGVDLTRLAALEGRMAQAEARIAAQDLTILQLRQSLMAKDARFVESEQATRRI